MFLWRASVKLRTDTRCHFGVIKLRVWANFFFSFFFFSVHQNKVFWEGVILLLLLSKDRCEFKWKRQKHNQNNCAVWAQMPVSHLMPVPSVQLALEPTETMPFCVLSQGWGREIKRIKTGSGGMRMLNPPINSRELAFFSAFCFFPLYFILFIYFFLHFFFLLLLFTLDASAKLSVVMISRRYIFEKKKEGNGLETTYSCAVQRMTKRINPSPGCMSRSRNTAIFGKTGICPQLFSTNCCSPWKKKEKKTTTTTATNRQKKKKKKEKTQTTHKKGTADCCNFMLKFSFRWTSHVFQRAGEMCKSEI